LSNASHLPQALETCTTSFGVLVDCVRRAQAAGVLRAGDTVGYAQVIWSACHGAASLELRQISFMKDLDAQYEELISTLIDGLAPGDSIPRACTSPSTRRVDTPRT
jgi:Tetracyclin repressor-like, C-terminal domain